MTNSKSELPYSTITGPQAEERVFRKRALMGAAIVASLVLTAVSGVSIGSGSLFNRDLHGKSHDHHSKSGGDDVFMFNRNLHGKSHDHHSKSGGDDVFMFNRKLHGKSHDHHSKSGGDDVIVMNRVLSENVEPQKQHAEVVAAALAKNTEN